jgi:hypothetical protein
MGTVIQTREKSGMPTEYYIHYKNCESDANSLTLAFVLYHLSSALSFRVQMRNLLLLCRVCPGFTMELDEGGSKTEKLQPIV